MDSKGDSAKPDIPAAVDLLWSFCLTAGLALGLTWWWDLPPGFLLIAGCLHFMLCSAIAYYWPSQRDFGPANRATLLRATLVIVLVASAPFADQFAQSLWFYGIVATIALLLDGVDGAVARATHSQTAFGARFDMELDAALLLGLCVAVVALEKAGGWVLALGAMRYVFLIAALFWQWLNRPLPESFRRKTICVWQLVTLMVAILPPVSPMLAGTALTTAMLLLCWSFLVDIRWLYQRRYTHEIA